MFASSNPARVQALLFDLGNVLIRVHFERALEYWNQRSPKQAHAQRLQEYLSGPAHHAFETGQLSATQFFQGLRVQSGLNLDETECIHGWNRALGDEIPGIRACLQTYAERYPLYLFSNTNATHWRECRLRYADLLKPFRAVFTSCELGLRKPEQSAFHLVASRMRHQPEQVLFFDDHPDNVNGAIACGMQAAQVRSLQDITRFFAGE